MIQEALTKIVQGIDLERAEMGRAIGYILDGQATPAQIGAFLMGLRMKGETIEEITGAAMELRSRAARIPADTSQVSLDRDEINIDRETIVNTTGTEEEATTTFNVSTTTAFVVAGAGLKVAKHGHRSVSSRCGSADVIEALGVNIDMTPSQVAACIGRIGIGFLYARSFQSDLGPVMIPRREVGLRTIFNLIGPLANPAGASVQVLGVYSPELTETMGRVLDQLGCRSAYVVHGRTSRDEISITGPSRITRLKDGKLTTFDLVPEDVGLERAEPEAISGGTAQVNAEITRAVLGGEAGPRRDMVLLNAAAALAAAGMAAGLEDGVRVAAEAIDSGQAARKLDQLVAAGLDSSSRIAMVG